MRMYGDFTELVVVDVELLEFLELVEGGHGVDLVVGQLQEAELRQLVHRRRHLRTRTTAHTAHTARTAHTVSPSMPHIARVRLCVCGGAVVRALEILLEERSR